MDDMPAWADPGGPSREREGNPPFESVVDLRAEVERLRSREEDLRLQVDILRKAVGMITKDPGVDPTGLSNHERSLLVDTLRDRLPVCARLRLPRSCYWWHRGWVLHARRKAIKRIALGVRVQLAFIRLSAPH